MHDETRNSAGEKAGAGTDSYDQRESMMSYEYRCGFRIYQISEDGILKVPNVSEGYGYYHSVSVVYETEVAAVAEIQKFELGECVILPVVHTVWTKE